MKVGEADYEDAAVAFREGVKLAGGQAATARLLDVSQPTVWRWLRAGKACPADHVPIFSKATGLSYQRLRPDLFGSLVGLPSPAPDSGGRA